jgi:hypothetical protein
MNRESRLFVDIWTLVGDQFPKAQRLDAVITLLRAFQDFGIEPDEFEDATDEDPYILHGFEAVVEKDETFDNYDDEEGHN